GLVGRGGGGGGGGAAAVAAGEEVLDELVRGELAGLARPGGGQGAAVDVLGLGELAGLGRDAGDVVGVAAQRLGGQHAGGAAHHHGRLERRGREVHVPLGLAHADADLERAVDLAVLQEVA